MQIIFSNILELKNRFIYEYLKEKDNFKSINLNEGKIRHKAQIIIFFNHFLFKNIFTCEYQKRKRSLKQINYMSKPFNGGRERNYIR